MSYIKRSAYTVDPQLFNTPDNLSFGSVTINNTKIGLDKDARKTIQAGTFVSRIGASEFRWLPRATTTAAVSTSSATVTVSPTLSNLFIAGDVLYPVLPHAVLTLSGTLAVGDAVTLTVAGYAVVVTATSTGIPALVVDIATAVNTHPILSTLVTAIASGSSLFIFGEDGITRHTVAVAETGTGLTAAFAGSATTLAAPDTAIGTVLAVNTTTGVITLSGNAGVALPVGAKVGVRVNEILGINNATWDFTDMNIQNVSYYQSVNGIRTARLPYIDGDIKRRLGNLLFATGTGKF